METLKESSFGKFLFLLNAVLNTWTLEVGDMAAFEIAITAGLRVIPRHEELLALQKEANLRCHNSGFHSVA